MTRLADFHSAASVGAIGVGIVLGSALRDIPTSIADFIFMRNRDAIGCGSEAAADCAVIVAPEAIIEVARFGLAVLMIAVLLALVGAVMTASGWHRLRAEPPTVAGHRTIPSSGADHRALGLLACGVSLMMPALWLAASFVAAVAT